MEIFDAIRSCPRWINSLSWGSLIALVIKTLVLDHIRAPLPMFVQLGPLADNLLASNFAAYVFLVVSVQIPAVRDKRHLGPALEGELAKIAHASTGFLTGLAYSKGEKLPAVVTKAFVDELFDQTDPRHLSVVATRPPNSRTVNWLEALAKHYEWVAPSLHRTRLYSRYLDAELLRLLSEIEDAPISESLNDTLRLTSVGVALGNSTMSAWADNFWHRYELEQRLGVYRAQMMKAPTFA